MARVLIVEDEIIIGTHLKFILREHGHETAGPVARGEDVQAAAQDFLPDVVLMDIHLAGDLSGTQAAARLTDSMDVAIVYLTAFADDLTVRQAQQASPYGYLVKPFEPDTVRTTVEVVGNRLRSDIENMERIALEAGVFEELEIPVVVTDLQGVVRSCNEAATILGDLVVDRPIYNEANVATWQAMVDSPRDVHEWAGPDGPVEVTARQLGSSILVTLARQGMSAALNDVLRGRPRRSA